jgi:hypothetical protein
MVVLVATRALKGPMPEPSFHALDSTVTASETRAAGAVIEVFVVPRCAAIGQL